MLRLCALGWLLYCTRLQPLCFWSLHRLCSILWSWSWPWCWLLLHSPGFWWMRCCLGALAMPLRSCWLLSWRIIIITVAKVYRLFLTSLHTNGYTGLEG